MTERIDLLQPRDERGNDANDFRDDPDFLKKLTPIAQTNASDPDGICARLRKLSATNRIKQMEANLDNDSYAIDEMALTGQITLFYAWPGTGKTLFLLWFLRQAIERGDVTASDVFYINADDTYKGLLTKSRIAAEHGFHMISPSESGLSPKDVLLMLRDLAECDEARGKVFVLDTLKKFADMMSKSSQAELYEILRRLVAKNATVILAGHANKHKVDDALIYEGTSDTMNDVDCVYSIYRLADKHADEMIVEFRNEKDRGDVIRRVSYGYSQREGLNYHDKLESVHRLDDADTDNLRKQADADRQRKRFESEILFIRPLLEEGEKNQSDIIAAFEASNGDDIASEISKRSIKQALAAMTGIEWQASRKKSANNALVYSLPDAGQYAAAKWGES